MRHGGWLLSEGSDADEVHISHWNVLNFDHHPEAEETLKPPLD
jgi:hypothetical protein